jgi:hypothetical protein
LLDELLTNEEREIRDKVRAFCDREVLIVGRDITGTNAFT